MAAIEEAPVRQARLKGISEAYARALSGTEISWLGAGLQTAALSRFILRFPDRTARDYFLSEAERRGIAASTELVEIGAGCKSLQSSPVASELLETTASLPFYPDLSDEEVADVCDLLVSTTHP
jgi:dTDP-4-amino-4,6-dideoxygalactose transaminase